MTTRRTTHQVTMPTEHGGWSLTLEPVALGLLVVPSWAGLALGAAALLAFLARTPAKVALVDRRRQRRLERTTVAGRVAVAEGVVIGLLVGVAVVTAEGSFWPPLAIAAPLVGIELWYDIRSRSRHLVPELAGSVGIAAVAAAIVLAGGEPTALAFGLWAVAAARAIAAVAFVRLQLRRFKEQRHRRATSNAFQAVAVAMAAGGVVLADAPVAGLAAIVGLALVHVWLARRPPPRAAMLGAQQVVLGLTVVLITGLAAVAP
jgi:hypothetical protein